MKRYRPPAEELRTQLLIGREGLGALAASHHIVSPADIGRRWNCTNARERQLVESVTAKVADWKPKQIRLFIDAVEGIVFAEYGHRIMQDILNGTMTLQGAAPLVEGQRQRRWRYNRQVDEALELVKDATAGAPSTTENFGRNVKSSYVEGRAVELFVLRAVREYDRVSHRAYRTYLAYNRGKGRLRAGVSREAHVSKNEFVGLVRIAGYSIAGEDWRMVRGVTGRMLDGYLRHRRKYPIPQALRCWFQPGNQARLRLVRQKLRERRVRDLHRHIETHILHIRSNRKRLKPNARTT